MRPLEQMIKNESVEDILLVFSLKSSYPSIDRMYVRFNFEVIEKNELWTTYKRLLDEGKLTKDNKGKTIKGPNWKEPEFSRTKKYSNLIE
ncbi:MULTISPECIES: immunity protein [Xenorhabdus]|uniref:Immunity protein n=2 Tax=Xenorhabdus TaxID=626 RepID=A0A2G0Q825_XENHO|nr:MULTISPECIES: immunity protein [Xenorhabdus]AOM41366.1 immunity protein [Xenorhabdus hominickii]MDC9597915.1 immunity protein [Xenorhabdus anantnagensis]PHM55362.1 immunity protein [Xenorhabdus hominickii]PHM57273.1 immunity protein [Xenorhabdus hominickii]